MPEQPAAASLDALKPRIHAWGRDLGFSEIGFTTVNLGEAEHELMAWLASGYHGDMDYMARHGVSRARPAELVPGTTSIISARMQYLPSASDAWDNLAAPERAYVARYALGRDYHKLMRNRLQKLGEQIAEAVGGCRFRAFSDSAPVMEVALARNAGLGWRGKHTLLLDRAGSWFFLGELFVDIAFTPDAQQTSHCGSCQACIDICPTRAILAPYLLDARRCISYLTIEHAGTIPTALRPLMGNRIYGCDDCQLICPWNRFAKISALPDFQPRNQLDSASLIELFAWNEDQFLHRLAGSPIRRIGHERWLRNIAVALGNALASNQPAPASILDALNGRADHPSSLVREHLQWALSQQSRTYDQPT